MVYIPSPDAAMMAFGQLLHRAQSVGLTNAHLIIELGAGASLAAMKPIAQVAPETIELNYTMEGNAIVVRLGDLMDDTERVILANVYVANDGANNSGEITIASVYIRYDDPAQLLTNQNSPLVPVMGRWVPTFTPQADPVVHTHVLALGKYRQTQLAVIASVRPPCCSQRRRRLYKWGIKMPRRCCNKMPHGCRRAQC